MNQPKFVINWIGTKWIANESTWIPPYLVMSNRQKFRNYWPTVQYWCKYTEAIDCSIRTFHYQDNQFSCLTFPVSRPCHQCLHLSSRPLSPGHLYSLSPSTTTQLLQRYKLHSEEDRIINKAIPTFPYSFECQTISLENIYSYIWRISKSTWTS